MGRVRDDEFEPVVPDGTDLRLAVSTLIKYLRRGRELEAYHWARQIEVRYWRHLWRRLCVFAAEDVGLANPQAVVVVRSLAECYATYREESRGPVDRSFLAMAVLLLARSDKSREAADFCDAYDWSLVRAHGWSAPIPDVAYDLHTVEGRERMPTMGERIRQWVYEASKVTPDRWFVDWRAWMRRHEARQGHLDRDAVEGEIRRWDEQGRLLYGEAGYLPGEEDG